MPRFLKLWKLLPLLVALTAGLTGEATAPGAWAAEGPGVVTAAATRPPGLPAAAGSVQGIRLGVHPDRTRIVVEMSGQLAADIAVEREPSRLVIVLPGASWNGGATAGNGAGLVTAHRVITDTPHLLRLVFDARAPVEILESFTIPARDGHPPRLVVDLRTSVAAAGSVPPVGRAETARAPGPALPLPKPAAGTDSGPIRPRAKPAREPDLPPPLIALDPGHGGVDPGALGAGGVMEKEITLVIAREVRTQLNETKRYRVLLTRDRDVFLPLRDRVALARDAGADLFISLHADTIDKSGIAGLSIYTLSDTASDREAEMLAAKENRADAIAGVNLATQNQDVASILISLAQRNTMNESNRFAVTVLREVGRDVDLLPSRPHRQAGFAVLTAPDTPSVLIELGYLSNPRDLSHLADSSYRKRLARGIVRGIDAYFKTPATARRS